MIAGVIYYFEEENVKQLFEKIGSEFEKCEIVFDYSSPKGVEIANKKVIDDGGMEKSAYLKWGIKNIYDIEKWNTKIKILENMKMFHDHKKRYPIQKRLGMIISDALSVMSLALLLIELNGLTITSTRQRLLSRFVLLATLVHAQTAPTRYAGQACWLSVC